MFKLLASCLVPAMLIFQCSVAQPSTSVNNKPGKTFRDCPDCPEMVVIPAGSFMMGAAIDEPGKYPLDSPQRRVNIRPFAVGKYDVTRGQWATFVAATKRPESGGCSWSALPFDSTLKPWDPNPAATWKNLGFPQDDSHPAVCLTWTDVHDYVDWLSKKTGAHYRLLTEAEWEYAARAGTTGPFPWGSDATHEYANYGKETGYGGFASGRDQWIYTSPVGSFPPNAFGLYDMNGNVLQYVEDCFALYNPGLPNDGSAYQIEAPLKMTGDFSNMNGKNSCSFRMVRGGDWGDPPRMVRSSFRNWAPGPGATLENYNSAALGFRVAKSL